MLRTLLLTIAALLAVQALAVELTEAQRAAIEERIRPVGEACLQGDASCAPSVAAVADGGSAARSGKEVYDAACMACHMTGAAGAPKLGDAAAWAERIAGGLEALYDAGINGVPGTGMVARGGCGGCSDEEIKAAVDYMVAQSE